MRRFLIHCFWTCNLIVLCSCQVLPVESMSSGKSETIQNYHPQVMRDGHDHLDTSDAESCLRRVSVNLDMNSSRSTSMFRNCLIEKGYQLIQ